MAATEVIITANQWAVVNTGLYNVGVAASQATLVVAKTVILTNLINGGISFIAGIVTALVVAVTWRA